MGESGMSNKAKAARIAAGSGAILSLGASLVATASPAGAATFNVTTNADAGAGSLRDAITQANLAAGPDTITFQAGLGTIALTTGEIDITDDLTITDPEGDVTVDAAGSSRIFYITAAGAVTITGLTLDSGFTTNRGGAVASFETDLTITDSTISGSDSDWGGGVFAYAGTVTITDTTFDDNSSESYGGGLAVYRGSATVTGSTFSTNVAYDHGGGASFDNVTTVSVSDSTFAENSSDYGFGGGIWAYESESVTVVGSTFTDNRANAGGGIGIDNVATISITDSTLADNLSDRAGGGLAVGGTQDITMTSTTISGNTAGGGGGVAIHNHGYAITTDISGSTFDDNTARYGGGGLYLNSGSESTTTVTTSTFSGNSVTGGESPISLGGAILADNAGSLTVDSSTISGNAASVGGGIAVYDTQLLVTNATISGNTAQYAGGGVAFFGGDNGITISHSTITGNTANYGGGLFLAGYEGNAATLDHNIIEGTTTIRPQATEPTLGDDGAAIFVAGDRPDDAGLSTAALDSVTLTNSLVNGTVAGEIVDGGGNLFELPANLGPLGDNGGPTATHDLLAASAALNAGDAAFTGDPTTDQRGLPRVSNARIDIGAVEVQVQTPVVPPVIPPVAPPAQPVPANPTFTG